MRPINFLGWEGFKLTRTSLKVDQHFHSIEHNHNRHMITWVDTSRRSQITRETLIKKFNRNAKFSEPTNDMWKLESYTTPSHFYTVLTTTSLLSRPTTSAKTLKKIARARQEPCLICPSSGNPCLSNDCLDFAGLGWFFPLYTLATCQKKENSN